MPDDDFINLGKKPEELKEPSDEPRTYYPSLRIVGDADMKLPDRGAAIIKFNKGDSGKRTLNGKTEYYCELEVTDIKPLGGSKPAKRGFGESLDRAVAKRAKADEADDSEEEYED
jgi:hypothetical protein